MAIITVKQAALQLGYKSDCGFYDKNNKLSKYVLGEKGHRMFDMGKYKKDVDTEFMFVERIKQFVEYLKHIENIDYKEMARISKVHLPTFYSFEIGYVSALKIARSFSFYRPFTIKRFDEYYGWKTCNNTRKVKYVS